MNIKVKKLNKSLSSDLNVVKETNEFSDAIDNKPNTDIN